eukprot:jgi/Undpi1/3947/HiC_scaffold_16.g07315.m1
MEDRYRRTKQLSSVLRALRHPSVLTDSSRWRDATENADAYLAGSHLSLYNSMEPMDAIRGIAGLCDDAETVLKETVQATYKTLVSCSNPGCLHKEGVRWEHEEHLRCTRSTAQQTVDARATASNSNGTSFYPCKACGKKVASKTFVMAVPPPCLVATWPCLMPVGAGQDKLVVQSSPSDISSFKISVIIALHQKKTVCMFREGQDYYRVEGHDVKKVQAFEWFKAKPKLALFTRQRPPRGSGASVASIPPTPDLAGGARGPGKKRRRSGGEQFSEGARGWSRSAAKAAEVIEVNDDDSDGGGAPVTSAGLAGDRADDDDIIEPNSARGRKGCLSGGAVEDAGTSGVGGGGGSGTRSTRDDGKRGLKRASTEALDEEDGDVCDVDGSSAGAANGRGADERCPDARAGPSRAEAKPSALGSGYMSKIRNIFGVGAAEEPNRNNAPDVPRRSCFPVHRPLRGQWELSGGNWSECSDPANGGSGSRSHAAGKVTRGQQNAAETHDRTSPSHEDLTTGDEGSRPEDDDGDDDVQLVTGHTPGAARRGTVAPPSPVKTTRVNETESGGRANIEEDCQDTASASAAIPSPTPAPTSSPSPSCASSAATPSSRGLPRVHSPRPTPQRSDVIDGDSTNTAAAVAAAVISAIALSPDLSFCGDAASSSAGAASSSLRRPRIAQSRSERLEVHAVDDAPTVPPPEEGQVEKEKEEVTGPTRPPPTGVKFVGPARPPARALPRLQQRLADFKFAAHAVKRPRWKVALGSGDAEWRPRAGTKEPAEDFGLHKFAGRTRGSIGSGGGAGGGPTTRKMMEDLTETDGSSQETGVTRSGGGGGGGGVDGGGGSGRAGLKSELSAQRDETTITTIRGINLQQDHFDRIVNSDGWLTSQARRGEARWGGAGRGGDSRGVVFVVVSEIIDIRVKQLQEKYPENLYFDSSFFGFLCPTTDKGGAFVVDYERVRKWTKSSRLPAGKSTLFDLRKLFIPINQANVHWVLVVVDMEGPNGDGTSDGGIASGSGGGGSKVVSFYDSFGKDGTSYVEAVQQYLVSELSSRDKTRDGLFATKPTPPPNSPQQENSSDCGVLMLHVMEVGRSRGCVVETIELLSVL